MGRDSVELVFERGEWTVVILEGGEESRHTFTVKEHAENWLSGQRVRLGLAASPKGTGVRDVKLS